MSLITKQSNCVTELSCYVLLTQKAGHLGDVLPSQSLASVLKKTKPNTTKANNTKNGIN